MRLIDAEVLKQDINKVSTHWLNEWSTLGVLAMVDKQPTVDAVEVVRCKDCKHTKTDGMANPAIYCKKWDRWEMPSDFYCKYGERKGGGENEKPV